MADVKINVKVITSGALKAVRGLNALTKNVDNTFKTLNKTVNNTSSIFKGVFAANLATQFVNKFSSAVVGLGVQGFKTAKNLETLSTQFEVLTGSAGAANAIVQDLTDFAARTPFRFEGIAKAATRLLSFGFTADEVKDRLQDLGDVAGASGADLGELSLIFGQVRAAGQLTGERLLQFQERAIPIGPAIAKTLGVAESAVKDLVSSGAVDFATFEKAFRSLNDEGEFAFGGLEKSSQTLEGRLSTLAEDVELLSSSIFTAFVPAFKAGAAFASEFLSSLRGNGEVKTFAENLASGIPGAVRFAADALITLTEVVSGIRIFINQARAGFNIFANSLVEGTITILEATAAAKSFFGLDTSGLDSTIETLRKVSDTLVEVGTESLDANLKIEKSQLALTANIVQGSNTIIGKFKEETQAAIDKGNAEVIANEKVVQSEATKLGAIALLREEARASEEEFIANEILANELRGQAQFDLLVQGLGVQEAAKAAARAKELEDEGKHQEALKVLAEARLKAEANRQKKEAQLEKDRVANRQGALSTIATLQNSNNKTLAAAGKAAAITQIAIDGPQAVTKALAAFPPPFNFIAAGLVGAAVAAQAAKVAGVGFENGGIVGGNSFTGDNVPVRVNSGEMILNKEQQGQLFQMANNGGGGGQTIQSNITVELDGDVVARSVSRKVADGLELGEAI